MLGVSAQSGVAGPDLDDALRAVAVNSSFTTSGALSKWLRRGVRLHTDGFVKQPFSELSHAAGAPDAPVAAVHMMLQGDIRGDVLLVMPEAVGFSLVDMLLHTAPGTTKTFGDLEISCLQETGNIVGTSFANCLAQWLSLSVVPAAPSFVHDLACAVVEPLVFMEAANSDGAWIAKTEFELDSHRLDWSLMLMLPAESLELIRGCCDREQVRRNALHTVAVNAAFHASRAISKWLKRGVRLTTEGFVRVPLRDTDQQFESDNPVVILHMELMNQLHGHLVLALEQPAARSLVNRLMPGCQEEGSEFGELARSCLCETANIIGTSFSNSVSKWLEIQTTPSPPELRIDMPQAALASLLTEQAAVSDEVLMSKAVFRLEDEWLDCAFYLLPTPASFRLIEAFCS